VRVIGSGRQFFCSGRIADTLNLATVLRSVVFVSEPTLGGALNREGVGLRFVGPFAAGEGSGRDTLGSG
jgi:hypothetical protein